MMDLFWKHFWSAYLEIKEWVKSHNLQDKLQAAVVVAVLGVMFGGFVLLLSWDHVPLPKIKSSVPVNGQIDVFKDDDVVRVTVCYSKRDRRTWENIKRSARKFDGMELKPHEKFSWLKDIGKCGYEEGYALGGGFDGREYGGGICFTATAYFRMMYTIKEELDDDIHCKGYSHHTKVWYATDRNDVTVDGDAGVDLTSWNETSKTLHVNVEINERKRTVTFTGKLE